MKTVLIIQNELPGYRAFLWQGLRKHFNLYLADAGANRLILPDGSVLSFNDYVFTVPLDCMVLNAGIREISKTLRYIRKYRPSALLGWTQFVGKNKGLMSRVVKSLYLTTFFDKILLYYEHEKRLMPFTSLRMKAVGLNNTIADWSFSAVSEVDQRSILFLGRFTEKSKLALLLNAAMEVNGIEVHIIGAEIDELPDQFRQNNFHFHGKTDDLTRIQDLAASCTYFVYPGDVGLSIVHAVKLGLVPVVHADLDTHMPECRAVAEEFPVVYFQKDDQTSLSNILKLLLETKPTAKTREWIAYRGRKIFGEEVMISNFVKAVEGC